MVGFDAASFWQGAQKEHYWIAALDGFCRALCGSIPGAIFVGFYHWHRDKLILGEYAGDPPEISMGLCSADGAVYFTGRPLCTGSCLVLPVRAKGERGGILKIHLAKGVFGEEDRKALWAAAKEVETKAESGIWA